MTGRNAKAGEREIAIRTSERQRVMEREIRKPERESLMDNKIVTSGETGASRSLPCLLF